MIKILKTIKERLENNCKYQGNSFLKTITIGNVTVKANTQDRSPICFLWIGRVLGETIYMKDFLSESVTIYVNTIFSLTDKDTSYETNFLYFYEILNAIEKKDDTTADLTLDNMLRSYDYSYDNRIESNFHIFELTFELKNQKFESGKRGQ